MRRIRDFGRGSRSCRRRPRCRRARRAQTRELATQGELLDRVVAIVNDGVVLNSDLDDAGRRGQRAAAAAEARAATAERAAPAGARAPGAAGDPAAARQARRREGPRRDAERGAAGRRQAQQHHPVAAAGRARAAGHRLRRATATRSARRSPCTLLRQRDVLQHISVTPREIDQFLEKQAKTPSERNEYNVSHILIAVGQEASPAQLEPPASARRRSTSAPRAARTSPSSPSPTRTARPRSMAARSAGARAASCPPSSPTRSRSSSPARSASRCARRPAITSSG